MSILRDEWEERNLLERAQELTKLRTEKVENETIIHLTQELDREITEVPLTGERLCTKARPILKKSRELFFSRFTEPRNWST